MTLYRIVSALNLNKGLVSAPVVDHSYSIEVRSGRFFKSWSTFASGFEHTDNGAISYHKFKTYEDAELYLMQKIWGAYVKRDGNKYEVTYPTYYF